MRQGLLHVARLTTLTELRLASCNKVTAAGFVAAVGRLPRLTVLALEGCAHVDDSVAAALLARLPHLDSLSTAGCHKVLTTTPDCNGQAQIRHMAFPSSADFAGSMHVVSLQGESLGAVNDVCVPLVCTLSETMVL